MITLIEALNYSCLRYVQRPLKPFHVLVGPNASGKTTFLDVIGFLCDLVSEGLDEAFATRCSNHDELFFRRESTRLELAIEATVPAALRRLTSKPEMDTARYEVAIGFDETQSRCEFKGERLLLKQAQEQAQLQRSFFPMQPSAPNSLLSNIRRQDNKVLIHKVPEGNDNFYSEVYGRSGRGWTHSFRLGSLKSALGNLPADKNSFPIATWFREYLTSGVQRFALNSLMIQRPSPPSRDAGFLPDGSNVPWVVNRLHQSNPDLYRAWIKHLQTALPDLENIATFERPEDRHAYMIYEYRGGLRLPSWTVPDGTLRLTALTLPAYLTDFSEHQSIYLIEEPENGIHPKAVATALASLSSVYEAQVLLATHSPIVLNEARMEDVLCFAQNDDGSTDVVLGSEHPALQQWQAEVDLGTLLASGVLG